MPISTFLIQYPPNGWGKDSCYYYREFVNFLDSLDIFTYESGYYPEPSGSGILGNQYTYFNINGTTNKLRLHYTGSGYYLSIMKKDGITTLWSNSFPIASGYAFEVMYNPNVARFNCNSQTVNLLVDNLGNIYADSKTELSPTSAIIGFSGFSSKIMMDGDYLTFPCYVGIEGQYISNRYIPNLFQVHQGSTFNSSQLLVMDGVQAKVHPMYTSMIMTL